MRTPSSVHLLQDLLRPATHLPGQLTGDILHLVIVVTTGHQVLSKGLLLLSNGYPIDQLPGTLQDLILLMQEIELGVLKTIVETEQILITADKI